MLDLERLINQAASTLNRFRLDGKVALVLGGSKGLGQAMAMALAAAEAEVCVVGRSLEDLRKTAETISELGRKSQFIAADVTRKEEVERMVAQVRQSFGHIDILVNSQGVRALKEFSRV